MKLAEALNQRADLQKRIAQLRDRLSNNVKVQEGDTPAEKPEDTKVMEGLSDRAFREAVKDDDEAIERALYSLLGDDSRSKK